VGCRVFLAGADGVVRAIDAVPTTPSTRRLDYVRVAAPNIGQFLGATAPPTAARCTPFARPDRATTKVDTPVVIGVLGNDSAAAAYFPLDETSVRLLDHGSPVRRLAVPGQGVFVADKVTGKVTFTPADGFTGPARTIDYRVLDSEDTPARSTIDVLVTGPQPGPGPGPRPGPGPGPEPRPGQDIPDHFPAGLSATPDGSLSGSPDVSWLLGPALAASAAALAGCVLAVRRRSDR
jgi:CshA-type fibril repeat protein